MDWTSAEDVSHRRRGILWTKTSPQGGGLGSSRHGRDHALQRGAGIAPKRGIVSIFSAQIHNNKAEEKLI